MADPHPCENFPDSTERSSGTPRWVKVFAAIAVILGLLAAVILLTGEGHGPGRHAPSGSSERHMPPGMTRALS